MPTGMACNNIFVTPLVMNYTITYYNESIQDDVLALPPDLRGRYFALADRMELHGPNLASRTARPLERACSSCA